MRNISTDVVSSINFMGDIGTNIMSGIDSSIDMSFNSNLDLGNVGNIGFVSHVSSCFGGLEFSSSKDLSSIGFCLGYCAQVYWHCHI